MGCIGAGHGFCVGYLLGFIEGDPDRIGINDVVSIYIGCVAGLTDGLIDLDGHLTLVIMKIVGDP